MIAKKQFGIRRAKKKKKKKKNVKIKMEEEDIMLAENGHTRMA